MVKKGHHSKVVVIGAGNVGATVAYTIMLSGAVSEIVFVDVMGAKASGEALDMNHGIAFFKQMSLRAGGYDECADADVVIITAGIGRKPGQTRIDLAKVNIGVVRDIAKNIMAVTKNPLILVISNPVDILTYIVQKETGLPPGRVFGSGTTLDTGRFRYLLSEKCKIDVRNIHAYIIGEHGDSEVPVWSRTFIGCQPFADVMTDLENAGTPIDKDEIFEKTKTAGAEIIAKKGATYYGIGMAASRIVSAIIGNEYTMLSVTSVVNGEYGISDIALSLPCVICSDGIDRIVDIGISAEEQKLLEISAQKLKDVLTEVNK